MRSPIDWPSTGLRPVAACGTSPPPRGAGPILALNTLGLAVIALSRRRSRHNTRMTYGRSRWPPPWSTLDMSNADFDTRNTSPGTRPTTANAAENGRKHPSIGRPISSTPGNRPAGHAQHHHPPPPATAQNPRIYGRFTVSSARPAGPFKRAAPPCHRELALRRLCDRSRRRRQKESERSCRLRECDARHSAEKRKAKPASTAVSSALPRSSDQQALQSPSSLIERALHEELNELSAVPTGADGWGAAYRRGDT